MTEPLQEATETKPETTSTRGTAAGGRTSRAVQLKASLRGHDYATQLQMVAPDQAGSRDVHSAAARGISGSGGALPQQEKIQQSFGGYDISNVTAHTDSYATQGAAAMGADAYATGNHVVLGKGGDSLHTQAHEAAHVVQQRAGVSLSGGVGKSGDAYEQHADAVADLVVQGKSAEGLLGEMVGGAGDQGVQMQEAAADPDVEGAQAADADPGAEIVVSMQADFADPVTSGTFNPTPQDIATYGDASRFAMSSATFFERILSHLPDTHPDYEPLAAAMWDLRDRGQAWAGNRAEFGERDIDVLNGLVASAHDTVGNLAEVIEGQSTEISWQFPTVGVVRTGRISGRRADEAVTFARWIQVRLNPLAAAVANTPGSQFANEMSTITEQWETLISDLGAVGTDFLLPSEWEHFAYTLIFATETMLRDMEVGQFRSVDVSLPEPFQLAGTREITTYGLLGDTVADLQNELSRREADLFHSDIPLDDPLLQRYINLRQDWGWHTGDQADTAGAANGWEHPLTPEDAALFTGKIEQFQADVDAILRDMDAMAAEAHASAAHAAAEHATALGALRDVQRQCFLIGDTVDLPIIASMVGSGLSFGDELNNAVAAMTGRGMFGAASSYSALLPGLLAKGFTFGNLVAGWSSNTPLSQGSGLQGMVGVSNAVAVMGAIASTWTSPVTLFTAHIGPMVAMINVMMTGLQLSLIAANDASLTVQSDPLYINAEPGGRPMWRYMVAVMRADAPGSIEPPSGPVFEYFESQRGRFESVTGDAMVTDGGLLGVTGILPDLDPRAFKSWVFTNRETVWTSLYGDREVPQQL